jgi:hypothetical protein
MKRRGDAILKQELQAAGAAPEDAARLTRLAAGLGRLKAQGPQLAVGHRPPQTGDRWWPALPTVGLAAAGGLLTGLVLVALAQTSFPGSWLYPVKRASEAVAVQAQPDYRAVLMMRRAQEVRELVAHNGSPRLVATTLHDYTVEATAYQAQSGRNYGAFRYCQTNLQQAETQAGGQERQAIAATLAAFPPDVN